jgi:hypothetical protein
VSREASAEFSITSTSSTQWVLALIYTISFQLFISCIDHYRAIGLNAQFFTIGIPLMVSDPKVSSIWWGRWCGALLVPDIQFQDKDEVQK